VAGLLLGKDGESAANGCGANIEVAMLVVAALRLVRIEMELDVN